MRRRSHPRASAGFALVEALASLVVVTMIALMLTQGVATGRRVWEGIDRREARGETVDTAQTALRDRIEQIYPATLYEMSPPDVDFDGEAETLTFLSNPPVAERPAPLRRYTLALGADAQLVLSSVSDVAPEGRGTVTRQVLLTGVRGIDLAYFGAASPDMRPQWRSRWFQQQITPELIRVRVAFEPGDPRQWPDLIVRPRVDIDTACLLNPISHHCKGRL